MQTVVLSLICHRRVLWMATDVHRYDKRLEGIANLIRKDERISEHNKELLFRFQRDMIAHGLGTSKLVRRLYDLRTICSRWLPREKRLEDVVIDDVKNIVVHLETSEYALNTKRDCKITLRMFYTWLRGGTDRPPEVAWFKTAVKKHQTKLPEELLTEEEIEKLINAEPNPRQRALIALLYETGCRIGELMAMKIKNIAFDEHGAQILVHGKTGYRRVRILASVPYLVEWLNVHPAKADQEAFVWTRRTENTLVSYNNLRGLIKAAAKRAGIRKKVNPHNFRHSRATALAKHLTESQMNQYLGWVQASGMASVYVHLSGRDVDGALLQMYGVKTDDSQKESAIKPKTCGRCKEVNGFANQLCKRCGNPLKDEKAFIGQHIERDHADDLLDQMLEDPEFKRVFASKMRDLMERKRLFA